MPDIKYANRIITDAKPLPPEIQKKRQEQLRKNRSTLESTHLLNVDGDRHQDFFFVDCTWFWKGTSGGPFEETHVHDFDEVISFVGVNGEDPHDLGGEIVIRLDGDKVVLNKSCLIFLPAGTPHGPVQINRTDRPIFNVTIAPTERYSRKAAKNPVKPTAGSSAEAPGAKPRYSIITETKTKFTVAASEGDAPKTLPRDPSLRSTRLLHLEDDMAKGSFYVDFVWIWEGNGGAPAPEHSHEWVELIAMVGADPGHPRDLGGTMSIVIGDETHYMPHSSLVCIPKGLKHCPWKFINIKKPTLVFTAGPSGMYTGTHKQ
jgi:hypothetical protein